MTRRRFRSHDFDCGTPRKASTTAIPPRRLGVEPGHLALHGRRADFDHAALAAVTFIAGFSDAQIARAAFAQIFETCIRCGLQAGWSRAVAEEEAVNELARVRQTLVSMQPHFVNVPGNC